MLDSKISVRPRGLIAILCHSQSRRLSGRDRVDRFIVGSVVMHTHPELYGSTKYWLSTPRGTSHNKPFLPLLSPNRLPILPKQTQLQNSTLAIQVATPMLSALTSPELTGQGELPIVIEAFEGAAAGAGTILGLIPRRMAVPARPTTDDRRKPALLRSMRYQSTGLTRARVNETWSVDCQGSLRCKGSSKLVSCTIH
jgi:hypothetical protein